MRSVIAFILCVHVYASAFSQCIDRNFLWNKVTELANSTALSDKDQLTELLGYLEKEDRCAYKNDSSHALLLHRIGVLYSFRRDYYNSIQYYTKAIALIRNGINNPAINPKRIVKSYYNLALQYEALGLLSKRGEFFDSCIATAMGYKTGFEFAAYCLKIKMFDYYNNGDYYKCVETGDISYDFIKNTPEKIDGLDARLFEFFTTKINALIALGEITKAKQLLNEAMDAAVNKKQKSKLGTLFGLYGTVLRTEKKYDSSLLYYQKSFLIHKQIKHYTGCAEALNNQGFVNSNWFNKTTTAISNFKQALQYADVDEALNTNANLANLYVKTHQFDTAFFYFQKAFDQLKPGANEKYLLQNEQQDYGVKTTEYQTSLVLDKADALMQRYYFSGNKQFLSNAVLVLQTADLYFDKIKNEQSEIQSKLFWKTSNRRLYEHALEACLALNNKEDAFYFFEKSRSVLLGDQLNEQRHLTDDELTKQAQLKKSIAVLERSISDTTTSAINIETLKQQLFTQKRQLDMMKGSVKIKPSFVSAGLPTISQVQQQILTGNKTLVELFYGDSTVYMISLSQSGSYFTKLNKNLYDSLTNKYIYFIADAGLLNKNFSSFVAVSNSLFELLFKNVPLVSGGSLIISPDGKSFPFEALITNRNLQSPAYLLMKYATSYTYSARYLMGNETNRQNDVASLLGLAPVNFKSGVNLPSLNGSDVSLLQISRSFSNATTFLFDSATSNCFSSKFDRYAILQLYTHAEENKISNDPIIYFADKPFYLSDLVAERQPVTRLVVLSACETAKGKFYGGEGVFSFNRGFAALGIPAAISNLWAADNQSTYRLTELFYQFLEKGLPTDVALQQAKIAFINSSALEDKKLPYFWSGTILTGKAETFKVRNNHRYYWLAGISAIVTLILITLIKKIFSRRKSQK